MTLQEMLDSGIITKEAFDELSTTYIPAPSEKEPTPTPVPDQPPALTPKHGDWFTDFVYDLNGDEI